MVQKLNYTQKCNPGCWCYNLYSNACMVRSFLSLVPQNDFIEPKNLSYLDLQDSVVEGCACLYLFVSNTLYSKRNIESKFKTS